MPGPRRGRYETTFASLGAYADHLITTVLGGVRVPDSDNTVPQKWALPKQTEEEYLMGLFDDLKAAGIEFKDVELDPFNYAEGKYICFVSDVEETTVKSDKNGEQRVIKFSYRFATREEGGEGYEGRYANKHVSDDKWLPNAKMFAEDKTDAMNKLSFVFQRFSQLGIPEPETEGGYGDIEMPDLIMTRGTKLNVTLKKNKPKDGTEARTYVNTVSVWEPPSMADMQMSDLAKDI